MTEFKDLPHNAYIEEIADALAAKTGNPDKRMFRVMAAWHLVKAVSTQHISVKTAISDALPVNMYAICLAPSGAGKGHAMSTIEHGVFNKYIKALDQEVHKMEEEAIARRAEEYIVEKDYSEEKAYEAARGDCISLGTYVDTFDDATVPAVKQLRLKIQFLRYGALNLISDEIGSNISKIQDTLSTFLELFDLGQVRQKITKVTKENFRVADNRKPSPSNLILFGTPSKVFDGNHTEKIFMDYMQAGYARRSFFSYQARRQANKVENTQDAFDKAVEHLTKLANSPWQDALANIANLEVGYIYTLTPEANKLYFAYKNYCEGVSGAVAEHFDEIKAEALHRHIKMVKLAAAFSALAGRNKVEEIDLNQAIALTEESSKAFQSIMNREKPYIRLAKYLTTSKGVHTQADLMDTLSYFNGPAGVRSDMLNMAIAWAYGNNGVITKTYRDSVEFLSGSKLEQTDLSQIIVSYSRHLAEGYRNQKAPWEKLPKLLQEPGMQFVTHWLAGGEEGTGHRSDSNIIEGTNLIVLDIDGTASIELVKNVFKDFRYYLYTTKSHKPNDAHFRILFPLSHVLHLNKEEYSQFMQNIYEWLPFEVDTAARDRPRKWAAHSGGILLENDGEMFEVTPFIPGTPRSTSMKDHIKSLSGLPQMERWFAMQASSGKRNNMLLRFAYLLVDLKFPLQEIEARVMNLNKSIAEPLPEQEIRQTIIRSVAQKIVSQQS